MTIRRVLSLFLGFCVVSLAVGTAAADAPVPALPAPEGPIGLFIGYLKERAGPLGLERAVAAFLAGAYLPGRAPVLHGGIGAAPTWVHFSVHNPSDRPLPRRLSVETAWLDRVEVYLREGGRTVAVYSLGDRQSYARRPVDSRHLALDHPFAPGLTEVYLRVQTPDPMVLPIYLSAPKQAHARERRQDYSYGLLYGFMFALLAYNLMLHAGLRDGRYLFYSLYLGLFLLMNVAYTGHGFRWLWPQSTVWAQWSNPVLMVLFGIGGLLFAQRFLDTRRRFPRAHKAVLWYMSAGAALLLLAMLLGSRTGALQVALGFLFLFSLITLFLGAVAVRGGQRAARYFLVAAFAAMVGAASTALSVWGVIPYSAWSFRAVEMGMLADATLLALALTYQFRLGQAQLMRAERLARLDPLTGINNRRAFQDIAAPIWGISQRHGRDLAVILLDIDRFKRINDLHGHGCGDQVLVAVAAVLKDHVRQQDVIVRWGGEEFLLLLPETDLNMAAALAERLRGVIAGIRVAGAGGQIEVTASFGVAQRGHHHPSLESLISSADHLLYRSKAQGRDRVSYA